MDRIFLITVLKAILHPHLLAVLEQQRLLERSTGGLFFLIVTGGESVLLLPAFLGEVTLNKGTYKYATFLKYH